MRLGILRRAGFLICSLLGTVMSSGGYDALLGKRQDEKLVFEPVTVTVTAFTQYTLTETMSVTVFPTQTASSISTPIVTVTSTEKTTTTTTKTTTIIKPKETGGLDGKRKRQLGTGAITITTTTTVWKFPDATETLTFTVTASPQTTGGPLDVLPITTTQVSTEINTVTVEETVTSTSSAVFSPSVTGSPLPTVPVQEGNGVGSEDKKGSRPNLAIILGTTFGAVLFAIIAFVAACLWVRKSRDRGLGNERYGGATRSGTSSGRGVKGLLDPFLGNSQHATRYNTLSNTDSSAVPLQSRSFFPPLPSHSPPPQVPALQVNTPYDYTFTSRSSRPPQLPSLHIARASESDFEYTFGSPVSSIGDAQLNSLTSIDIVNTPLPVLPSTEHIYPRGRETVRGMPVRSDPPPMSVGSAGSVISPNTSIRRKPLP